ncbi:hypothetical protein [Intestinirhabdus alba]|jgi:hypothetical protein|uniref:Lipoprotein n=1 Tax=Intestinirhabdus alba TaxID=2899544 RepID=A0A6L6ISB1_9ENTR|nr:hypothetical protein [Intestinirhabdus alba]MTH48864.1 hypothetical protein [Intestinirhabdus alba]
MKKAGITILLPLLTLTGCAVSQKLSPPQDGKHVKVAVVKPADVDILPMKVIYRSERCRDKILTSTGAISSRDGYHLLTVPFKPEAGSNVVSNAVAFDGGGQCGWKLSNIRFQFRYHDFTKFGNKIEDDTPEDIVFIFDDAPPPRGNGHYEEIYGDVVIKKDYYPVILKEFTDIGGDILYIKGQPMLTYRVRSVKKILFEPVFHSNLIVEVLSPQQQGEGYLIMYPNGEKIIDHSFPYSKNTSYAFVKQKGS